MVIQSRLIADSAAPLLCSLPSSRLLGRRLFNLQRDKEDLNVSPGEIAIRHLILRDSINFAASFATG